MHGLILGWLKSKTLFSVCDTMILERLATAGPSFLASPRNEAKRQQHYTKAPHLRTAAAAELASLKQASKKPRPLVPRLGVFQGDFKKPYAESVLIVFFGLFADKKNLKYQLSSTATTCFLFPPIIAHQ
ncbi:hypothetical protein HA050_17035 [Iodobacter sp. HSC-16F04]|uniref:Uncharacterized protein n=1 Tax=Iodobacter violaceini TaxID=3044271 RepID=A0ABX0KT27_9NEIS|nr:hypothetical protein [Iodobacter violacea]NHQ87820.1 hypothetical protein [Iodobacter violacea]